MTSLPIIAQNMRHGLPLFGARAAIVLGLALAIAPTPVLAKVQVGGSPEAVSIDAQNTSIKEILEALGNAFDVHYQSSANLEKQLTGTYEGSLQRVVMRVLEGYNVVVKTNNGRIEITVLGTRNAPAMAGASPASTASKAAQTPPAPLASSASNAAERPAATTPAAQPSTVSKEAEQPTPAASPAAPSPTIMLAEGPMPAIPSTSPGSAPSAVPEARPSTTLPPSPSPLQGSAASLVPEGRPSAVAPLLPGSAATNTPEPKGAAAPPPTVAGTTKPPIVDNPPPAQQ
jgi:hypothetical protein